MRTTLLSCLLMLALATSVPAQALTIAAAASLRQVMPALTSAFQQQFPDTPVRVIVGASGKLTTQILNGAPFDLLLSADTAYPEQLHRQGATAASPAVYAIGRLALWHHDPQRPALSLADLTTDAITHIAIAQPRHAPYGQRAREALQALGLWQRLQPKLVFGENIGQTAAMVESGAAEAGLIAWSLTFAPELAGRPFTLVDDRLHQPLTMAMVITRQGGNDPASNHFQTFMTSPGAAAILRRGGFDVPPGL